MEERDAGRPGDGGGAAQGRQGRLAVAFPVRARRLMLAVLMMFLGLDMAVAGICPFFGGDCLYGLFTLIAGPVLLAGLAGALLPRLARGSSVRLALLAGGAVPLAGLVVGGHVLAIRVMNGPDYGGVLIRPRLLAVGLGLAGAYYVGLASIALLRPGRGTD